MFRKYRTSDCIFSSFNTYADEATQSDRTEVVNDPNILLNGTIPKAAMQRLTTFFTTGRLFTKLSSVSKLLILLEAAIGIEPMNKGFADLCLTTWLRRRKASMKDEGGSMKLNWR